MSLPLLAVAIGAFLVYVCRERRRRREYVEARKQLIELLHRHGGHSYE